ADFGDIAAILPSFVAALLALWLMGHRRDAAAWASAMAAGIVVTALLKAGIGGVTLIFFGHPIRTASLPSGNAVLASIFYGGLGALLLYGCRSWVGKAAAVLTAGAQTAIIAAVYLLGWHPVLDLVCGIILGAPALWLLCKMRDPAGLPIGQAVGLVLASAIALGLFHGLRYDDARGV